MTTAGTARTRVFVYGSCVSRDTAERLDPDQFEIVGYVARQSLLSAASPPVTSVDPPTLPSRFQQRMVAGDFSSDLTARIAAAAPDTDLVIVDLTDERLGVHLLPDGTVVTRTPEIVAAQGERRLPDGATHLPFGAPRHRALWTQSVPHVAAMLRRHMPRTPVVLLDVPWAERSASGEPTPSSFGLDAEQMNRTMDPYVRATAEAFDATVLRPQVADVRSSPDHAWGEAPFHYAEDVYRSLVSRLTEGTPAEPSRHGVTPEAERGPDFLLAGAQRGGTGWLRRELAARPDVFVARGAGTNYFNRPRRLQDDTQTESYLAAFEGAGSRLRGECSPTYLWSSDGGPWSPRKNNAAGAARQRLRPEAQVLLTLRDPVSRAASAYWHHFAEARYEARTGIFRTPPELGVVALGFYREQVGRWIDELGPDRVHVLLYDDLVADPEAYLRTALAALDLPGLSSTPRDAARRATRVNHRPWLARFRAEHPVTAGEVAALLTLYRDDIAYVEDLVGRSLPTWREPTLLGDRLGAG